MPDHKMEEEKAKGPRMVAVAEKIQEAVRLVRVKDKEKAREKALVEVNKERND